MVGRLEMAMRNAAAAAAVTAVAGEETCIVIGVDADGRVRVSSYRAGGKMSSVYACNDQAWLRQNFGAILDESLEDARSLAARAASVAT
ncbi:MAG: hypothetical protein MUF08_16990 [Burkholderiaceae bacterium]|jgi:hypothetical protein|nr:hypothetical protein [Burkholderiaceae bacterium]